MIETIIWIALAVSAAVLFFKILEDWADIGPIDGDQEEDP